MGYLLKEALKTLCGVNQWSYAIFWKIGCQNPKLLIWEECYYEPIIYSNAMHGVQAGNKVHSLVTKMMKDNYVNLLGEGLVGRVAFTRNHQWIISDNKMLGAHPPEVSNEVRTQFSAGIQTIAVIPVHPHGVVQLGSSSTIMENMGFVNDVKSLISQLGCVPGALLSENYMKNEAALETSPNHGEPSCFGNSISAHSSGRSKFSTPDSGSQQGHLPQASGNGGHTSISISRRIGDNGGASGSTLASSIICQSSAKSDQDIPLMKQNSLFSVNRQIGVTEANLYFQDPKNDQETAFGSFSANYDPLRSMEHHILSDAFSGDHVNDAVMAQIARESNKVVRGQLAASSNPHSLPDAGFLCAHVGKTAQTSDSTKTTFLGGDRLISGGVNHVHHLADEQHTQPKPTSGKEKLEHELFQALTMSSEEACLKPPSRDDLFDIVGMDFKNKLFGGSRNNFVNNGVEANTLNLIRNDNAVLELQGAGSDLFSVYEGESDSGIYSSTASDHLLDAVVSKVHSSSKQISDDNLSCRTSSTKTSSSSAPVACSSSFWANGGVNLMHGELVGVPKSLKKTGATSSCSYKSGISKDNGGNSSETSSIISSQIGSWAYVRKNSGVSSEHAKKADETSKSNRKRLKPGENPRPRPKDRQMIQDRVKELREIVPNGAKCSIDALLERTIKHMLFLQSVTKHADKLKQTGESKIVSKDGGLLLRDNFEGGATWAYEVGSSMVCPIIVEDLNSPRQMLVEMLCEEQGSFLEIADIIKGLGLTILKGVMESRNDKIWAHFTVEANRDVTRMEIFLSLVSLLEQAVKNGDCSGTGNVSVDIQSFHQTTSTPTAVGPQ